MAVRPDLVCGSTLVEPDTEDRIPLPRPLVPADFRIPVKDTYTPREIAERLGVDVRTIQREIEDGNLEALPVRGSTRVPREALERYFRRQQAAVFGA